MSFRDKYYIAAYHRTLIQYFDVLQIIQGSKGALKVVGDQKINKQTAIGNEYGR